jgi:hypothetical protein
LLLTTNFKFEKTSNGSSAKKINTLGTNAVGILYRQVLTQKWRLTEHQTRLTRDKSADRVLNLESCNKNLLYLCVYFFPYLALVDVGVAAKRVGTVVTGRVLEFARQSLLTLLVVHDLNVYRMHNGAFGVDCKSIAMRHRPTTHRYTYVVVSSCPTLWRCSSPWESD